MEEETRFGRFLQQHGIAIGLIMWKSLELLSDFVNA